MVGYLLELHNTVSTIQVSEYRHGGRPACWQVVTLTISRLISYFLSSLNLSQTHSA